MVLFGLFQTQPEIAINLAGERQFHRRVLGPTSGQVPYADTCPIVRDEDHLSGKVVLRQKPGTSLDHHGIAVTLIGLIEQRGEPHPPEPFMSMRLQLVPAVESPITREITQLDFDFGKVHFPHPSYDGDAIALRYYLKVLVHRKISDNVKELMLWCPADEDVEAEILEETPIDLEVGLEEFLHLKLSIDRFGLQDEITGYLNFLLVRARVVDVDLSLLRKEIASGGQVISTCKMISKQIILGAASRGDYLPVQLDLASATRSLTPTISDLGKMFAIRYFVAIFLRDSEGRKYYKQVEVHLERKRSQSASSSLYPLLSEFKIGLVMA